MDPLATVEPNAAFSILSMLDPASLARCCAVSQAWRAAAGDERLWVPHCQALWRDKVYVPKAISDLHPKQAFLQSQRDSTRTAITPEELCAFSWTFRFRRVAGLHWMQHQKGRMLRSFHPDGSISAPSDDLLWQQHEDVANRWRMRKSKMGRRGCFVQINHWPSLEPRRSADWGWSMRNAWVVYKARLQQQQQQQQQQAREGEEGGGAGADQAAAAAGAAAAGAQQQGAASGEDGSSSGTGSDGDYSLTSGSDNGSSSSSEGEEEGEGEEDESSDEGEGEGGGGGGDGNGDGDALDGSDDYW